MELTGLHHLSAITAQAPQNVDFYTRLLGMRLVKKTVNQDDPSSYHLFYGDELGRPGTELTFFDIPYAAPTKPGTGSISRTALRVTGREALEFWRQRLDESGVEVDEISTEGQRAVLTFRDFEGQRLAFIDDEDAPLPGGIPWQRSAAPVEMGIKGLASVTLTVADAQPTVRVLTDVMGFGEQGRYRAQNPDREIRVFGAGVGGPGAELRVDERPDLQPERLGRGGVHHVAFRVPNEEEHNKWLDRLSAAGIGNSGIIDRFYFRSIYFREPNGILFELATDGPGFATDEDEEHLGESLALPPFLEPHREQIEANLQPLEVQATQN
ncbi:MAG TPA: ring-cleaving dioxygenase [Candidatus Sulfomarinibacteraceae bacterium]|nr:ring-cleaving dioxygenase [Candidatus Sulfomarinibacteraceae bacterium]